MPLKVDFSALESCVRQMGAEPRNLPAMFTGSEPFNPVGKELAKGKQIDDLGKVDGSKGVLSYDGYQILLYIQDQGSKIAEVLEDGEKGRRFHVADCKTLKTMREKGRFERYVITNKLDGDFYVSGLDWDSREELEGNARLWVCQNCIKALNYKGAQEGRAKDIARAFSIEEFFDTYSSFFPFRPSRTAGHQGDEGYTEDWPRVAAHYKAGRDFKCESCGVGLADHKNLLHVHHRNGVKSDNTSSNLQALCIACHREQPHHGHLFVPHKDTRLINRLRREQGLLQETRGDWGKVFEYCDPGLRGLLEACRSAGARPPEVGFDIQDPSQAVVANLELAWPKAKRGVAISDEDHEAASAQGWKVWTMFEALDKVDKFVEETRR